MKKTIPLFLSLFFVSIYLNATLPYDYLPILIPSECFEFNSSDMGNWETNDATAYVTALAPTSDNTLYLRAEDENDASWVFNDDDWTGDLACSRICFDYKVFEDGHSSGAPLEIYPNITIYSGGTVANPTYRATFSHPVAVTEDDDWVTVCADITPVDLPFYWNMQIGDPSDWSTLVANVTGIAFTTDVAVYPNNNTIDEEIGIDNICISELDGNGVIEYHFEDENGTQKTEFCEGEDVYLDGTECQNESQYFLEISRRPTGSSGGFTWLSMQNVDGWALGQVGVINISELFANDVEDPIQLEPGFEYQTLLKIANPASGQCVPELSLLKTFKVKHLPIPEFHFEDEDGIQHTSFCHNEEIYLNGFASQFENYHFIAITEIDPAGNSDYLFDTGPGLTWTQAGLTNLTTLMEENGFTFQAGYTYKIKLAVGNNCDNWVELSKYFDTNPTPEPISHFENAEGEEKTEFCFGEEIYLNGFATINETRHFIAITEIDPTGNSDYLLETGNIWTEAGITSLTTLMEDDGDYFKPNHTYRIKLAVGNYCVNWVELSQEFTVICCDENEPDPFFILDGLNYEENHYTVEAVNYDWYSNLNPVHEWYMYSSSNQTGGPYTPITYVEGEDFSHEPAQYNVFNFVIHRITTDCGEYCYTAYNNNGGGKKGKDQGGLRDEGDCSLIDQLFPSCSAVVAPSNLMVDGNMLTWVPVPGAASYIVNATIGGQSVCACGGTNPISLSIGTTTTNSIAIPSGLSSNCFSWNVIAICSDGASSATSETACYYPSDDDGNWGEFGNGNDGNSFLFGDDSSSASEVQVFPNPVVDELNFVIDQAFIGKEDFRVDLFNTTGQLIQSNVLEADLWSANMQLGRLPNGLYHLRFTNHQGQFLNKKIVLAK